MNESPERLLTEWLHRGPDQGPREGLERLLAATRRTPQRPRWTFPERWLPVQLTMRAGSVPRPAMILVVLAALLALAIAAMTLIGAPRRLPPPIGNAGNGTILFDVNGQLRLADAAATTSRPLEIGLGKAYGPVFSRNGTRFAFWTQPADRTPLSLYAAAADGSNAMNLTGALKVSGLPYGAIAWSPDGSKIAFSSSVDGTNKLFVAATDGSGVTALPASAGDRSLPAWSADGAWLAYRLQVDRPDGSVHLAIARPDGTDERILVSVLDAGASFSGAQWAPGSPEIAYFRKDEATHHDIVAFVDLSGTERQVSLEDESAFHPAWSPDGRRLAFFSEADGLVVADRDGSNRVEVPKGLTDCGLSWSPDASAILGLGRSCTEVYRIPLADPSAASRVPMPAGEVNAVSWQRLAP